MIQVIHGAANPMFHGLIEKSRRSLIMGTKTVRVELSYSIVGVGSCPRAGMGTPSVAELPQFKGGGRDVNEE